MEQKKPYIKRTPYGSIHNINNPSSSITGSCHKLEIYIGGKLFKTLMIDVGMRNGGEYVIQNNMSLPFDQTNVDATFLTHTHNDHSGLVPVSAREGNDNPIFMTRQSADIVNDIWEDSLYIQEHDLKKIKEQKKRFGSQLNNALANSKKGSATPPQIQLLERYPISQNHEIAEILENKYGPSEPLFSQDDIDKAYTQIIGKKYGEKFDIFNESDIISARFIDAGHIFGSGMILLEIKRQNSKKIMNILRCGDMGRINNRIYGENPNLYSIKKQIDAIFIESTYGGRNHPDILDEIATEYNHINQVFERGGSILRGSFTQERYQNKLLDDLSALEKKKLSEDTVIIADSRLAKILTKTMGKYNDIYKKVINNPKIKRVEKTQAEEILLSHPKNHIFHMSGGMFEGGTVMKIVQYFNKNNKNIPIEHKTIAELGSIIIGGYTPENTLGWKIKNTDSYNSLSLTYSSHIDHEGIINFITNKDNLSGILLRKNAKINLMHGEIGAMYKIRDALVSEGMEAKNIIIPHQNGESIIIDM